MFTRSILAVLLLSTTACSTPVSDDPSESSADEALTKGPGAKATDARSPELGGDLSILAQSQIDLGTAVAHAGPVVEAKFELGDDGKSLSLSLYPVQKGLAVDSERNVFEELSGDPTTSPFSGSLSTFDDQEHVLRSSRNLTLVQLSHINVGQAIARGSNMGKIFWAIPTLRNKRAGYGLYAVNAHGKQVYRFIDGLGSDASTTGCWFGLPSIGAGPGAGATDERGPELGADLSIVRQSKVTMAAALAQTEATDGPAIEAKFELADDGKSLSLSIYPVGAGLSIDAERNTFFELAGDPTSTSYAPSKSQFRMPDFEHVARSARDLTLVQAAGLTLREAVDVVNEAAPHGFVFWAVPTIRGTRAGYGVYTLGKDNKAHYYFAS